MHGYPHVNMATYRAPQLPHPRLWRRMYNEHQAPIFVNVEDGAKLEGAMHGPLEVAGMSAGALVIIGGTLALLYYALRPTQPGETWF